MGEEEAQQPNPVEELPPLVRDAITFINPTPLEATYLVAVVKDEAVDGRTEETTKARMEAAMALRASVTPENPHSVESLCRVAAVGAAYREMQVYAMDMTLQKAPHRALALARLGDGMIDRKEAEYKQVQAVAWGGAQ